MEITHLNLNNPKIINTKGYYWEFESNVLLANRFQPLTNGSVNFGPQNPINEYREPQTQ